MKGTFISIDDSLRRSASPEKLVGTRDFVDLIQCGHHCIQIEPNDLSNMDPGWNDSVSHLPVSSPEKWQRSGKAPFFSLTIKSQKSL
jgi:hypothetical protein